jgi:hypothetical protein
MRITHGMVAFLFMRFGMYQYPVEYSHFPSGLNAALVGRLTLFQPRFGRMQEEQGGQLNSEPMHV